MKSTAVILSIVMLANNAGAWPVFDEALDLAGTRFYPDSESTALWWQAVTSIRLANINGNPLDFVRYRYIGSVATGDSGTIWMQGLLTFHIVLGQPLEHAQHMRQVLAEEIGRPVTVRTVPAQKLRAGLTLTNPAGETVQLASGTFSESPAPGSPYPVQLVMTPASTQIFWRAMHNDGSPMSAYFDLTAHGYATRPEDVEDTPELGAARLFAGVVPVRASGDSCPQCFRSHDLGSSNRRALPTVDVFCCDRDAARDDIPVMVLLELEASGVDGGAVREKRNFQTNRAAGIERIEFSHAVQMQSGYRYRVQRVFESGALETTGWSNAAYWMGLLDISAAAFGPPNIAP